MLILIFVSDQYLRNVVFTFKKGLNGKNNSSSDSHYLMKKSPQQYFPFNSPKEGWGSGGWGGGVEKILKFFVKEKKNEEVLKAWYQSRMKI